MSTEGPQGCFFLREWQGVFNAGYEEDWWTGADEPSPTRDWEIRLRNGGLVAQLAGVRGFGVAKH